MVKNVSVQNILTEGVSLVTYTYHLIYSCYNNSMHLLLNEKAGSDRTKRRFSGISKVTFSGISGNFGNSGSLQKSD